MIKSEQMGEPVYDVIDVSGGANPSLTDETNKNTTCLSPSHRLLPTILPIVAAPTGGNVGVARKGEEEIVHATIPGK